MKWNFGWNHQQQPQQPSIPVSPETAQVIAALQRGQLAQPPRFVPRGRWHYVEPKDAKG